MGFVFGRMLVDQSGQGVGATIASQKELHKLTYVVLCSFQQNMIDFNICCIMLYSARLSLHAHM